MMNDILIKGYIKFQMKAKQFMQREDGASAIEYGIIAGLIAVVFMAAAGEVGGRVNAVFEQVRDALPAA